MKKLASIVMVMALAGLLVGGCAKKEPASPPAPTKAPTGASAAAVQQTKCFCGQNLPNKDVFVEYQGQKIYFCCADCKAKFEQAPAEAMKNLEAAGQKLEKAAGQATQEASKTAEGAGKKASEATQDASKKLPDAPKQLPALPGQAK